MTCQCIRQGFKDPDVLDLVRDRKTESTTLSANGRAMISELIASCRFVLTVGDVKAAFSSGRQGGEAKETSLRDGRSASAVADF